MQSPLKVSVPESPAVMAGRSLPAELRPFRRAVAAALLVLSVLVPVAFLGRWFGTPAGVDPDIFMFVFFPFVFYFIPVANIASLLFGDRRKTWVQLNYYILGVWLVLFVPRLLFSVVSR